MAKGKNHIIAHLLLRQLAGSGSRLAWMRSPELGRQVRRVRRWALENGLEVEETSASSLAVRGTPTRFRVLFNAPVRRVGTYWSWERDPEIPSALGSDVESVIAPEPIELHSYF